MKKRIVVIDCLKTIAIFGVLFYHLGILTSGYLGVDIFFVISGYLFVKSNKKLFEEKAFSPIRFLSKKLSQYWPLIAVTGFLTLTIGYGLMLPNDYENLAETVIASNFFGNNILQAITTGNYWDVGNAYKPLMHTWYIGVLFQSFIFLAIIIWAALKIFKKDRTKFVLSAITLISLILYLLPVFSSAHKFYFPQYRIFEITVGGLIAYVPKVKVDCRISRPIGLLLICVLIFLIFSGISLPSTTLLLLVVSITLATIYLDICINADTTKCKTLLSIFSFPGIHSYDIYIWHQVVIAFLYYSFFQTISFLFVSLTILITALFSFISVLIRKRIVLTICKKIIFSLIIVVCTSFASLLIYMHAGVIRDVPELGIDSNNVHRNMHAEYVDVPYSWDKDFEDNSKIHILVLGNSFGRDFANILNESSISDNLEISYIYGSDASNEMDRVAQADFVFYGADSWDVPDWINNNIDKETLYIVGNKGFGNSNGIIYINRNENWYFDQVVHVSDDFILQNNTLKNLYGDHYIDMISPLLNSNNELRVFTDDNYYISQDCRHLTKYGAQYYSRILNLDFIEKSIK